MPNAIGKSNWLPSFRIEAGDKFIVILFIGNLYPLLDMADLTLSFDSLIAVSGKPTILKEGNPLLISDSTLTPYPSKPCNTHVLIFDNIYSLLDFVIFTIINKK
jgi:hypothetical protein